MDRAHAAVQVTVDLVILTVREGDLRILLIERGNEPHRGQLALPGGFIREDENLPYASWGRRPPRLGHHPLSAHAARWRMTGFTWAALVQAAAPLKETTLMSGSSARALLIAFGIGLFLTGLGFGVYPNPWGYDGHSRLTCGSAFFGNGYSPYDPDCPARRTRMLAYSVVLMVSGAGLVFGVWWRSRRFK